MPPAATQARARADLASLPAASNAVAWSEDNLLAVATGRSVILLSPAALGGPRAVIDVPFTQATEAEAAPSDGLAAHLAFLIGSAGRGARPENRKSSTVWQRGSAVQYFQSIVKLRLKSQPKSC